MFIRQKSIALPALIAFGICVAALLPATEAKAQCELWDLTGRRALIQSNGYILNLSFKQTGTQLSGGGHYLIPARSKEEALIDGRVREGGPIAGTSGLVNGSFDGTIGQNGFFRFTVRWANNSTGVYTGTVTAEGQLRGDTRDAQNFTSQATFYSEDLAQCSRTKEAAVEEARTNKICLEYAETARKQNEQNIAQSCGFRGPGWESNLSAHIGWCKGASAEARSAGNADRARDLTSRCGIVDRPRAGAGVLVPSQPPASIPRSKIDPTKR